MNMRRTLTDWQHEIADAANKKFPNNSQWTLYDRMASVQDQLDDVIAAIKVEDGLLKSDDHAHQHPDHRIAALIADVLILAEQKGANVEEELEKVLTWFKKA